MENFSTDSPFSVYVHIPYCLSKCRYCDFASYAGMLDSQAAYFTALHSEINIFFDSHPARAIDTIYFGGGTPSIVSERHIAETIELLYSRGDVKADCEISMEANPATLTPAKLAVYKNAGINRLSIGMQSSSDRLLAILGRAHNNADTIKCVDMLYRAGIDNFNLDLMFALPEQSTRDFEQSLRDAVSLSPSHISAYSLIIEPNTPFYEQYRDFAEQNEQNDREMYHLAHTLLSECGYERYEISNFARSGAVCRHNKYCWDYAEYIGFGASAHSFIGQTRFSNASGIADYLRLLREKNSAAVEFAKLSLPEMREEFIMLSLRKEEGFSLEEYSRRFSEDITKTKASAIRAMREHGLIDVFCGRLKLTERGFDIANSIILELI